MTWCDLFKGQFPTYLQKMSNSPDPPTLGPRTIRYSMPCLVWRLLLLTPPPGCSTSTATSWPTGPSSRPSGGWRSSPDWLSTATPCQSALQEIILISYYFSSSQGYWGEVLPANLDSQPAPVEDSRLLPDIRGGERRHHVGNQSKVCTMTSPVNMMKIIIFQTNFTYKMV